MKIAAALTLAMAATANAACTTDDTKTMTDCAAKLSLPTDGDKTKMCEFYKGAMACYPKCYCDDSSQAAKDAIAASEKGYKDAGCDGEAKCGAGSMLAPGLAMAAVAVVVAKLA
eukprot:g1080.t1